MKDNPQKPTLKTNSGNKYEEQVNKMLIKNLELVTEIDKLQRTVNKLRIALNDKKILK